MDVSGFIVMLLVLSYGGLSNQTPQGKEDAEDVLSAITTNNVEVSVRSPQNCSTAKGVIGVCIDRQHCEYSTYAIDLTLFATKGYKRSCTDKDVCCPPGFQIPEVKSKWEPDFDED